MAAYKSVFERFSSERGPEYILAIIDKYLNEKDEGYFERTLEQHFPRKDGQAEPVEAQPTKG